MKMKIHRKVKMIIITSESEYNNASDSEDDFEDWKHSEKCKYSYEQMQKILEKSKKDEVQFIKAAL